MTRALLISNPFAARAHTGAAAIRDILQRGGWNVELHTTTGPGDARGVAEQARGAGFDVFVSHGGDGTAMQVASPGRVLRSVSCRVGPGTCSPGI